MDDTLTYMSLEPVYTSSGVMRPHDAIVVSGDNPDDWGRVFFRPYLRSFLEAVSGIFEVVVFTAASREYADQILDSIDPQNRLIRYRLYRESCLECSAHPLFDDTKIYVKDLRILGRDLSKVILIDNSLLSVIRQPDNGIVCNPYNGSENDSELLTLLAALHQIRLSKENDVRKVISKKYGLGGILQDYSCKTVYALSQSPVAGKPTHESGKVSKLISKPPMTITNV